MEGRIYIVYFVMQLSARLTYCSRGSTSVVEISAHTGVDLLHFYKHMPNIVTF